MKFENKEAENLFIELFEKYGLQHVNSDEEISVESLREIEQTLIKFMEEE